MYYYLILLFKNEYFRKNRKIRINSSACSKTLGVYKPTFIIDNFLYVSGQGPVKSDGSLIIGKAKDMDTWS